MLATIPATKVDVVPPMLPVRALTVAGIGGHWSIIRTKSCCEKAMAVDLLENGFDYFLPLLKRIDQYKRVTYSPIEALKGFLFVSSPEPPPDGYPLSAALQDYLQYHHAYYGFVPTGASKGAQAQLVRELEMIYAGIVDRRIKVGASVVKGIKCEVVTGPYRGCVGVIDSVTRTGWAMIEITALGTMIPLQVSVKDLEPV